MNFDFKNKIRGFSELLGKSDPDEFPGIYPKTYFFELLRNKNYYLTIYADLLSRTLEEGRLDAGNASLIDYGCGNGLLGLFAKYSGIRDVYFADMDPEFISATNILSRQLGIEAGGFIKGAEEDLLVYNFSSRPNIVLGTDVIEHVYNLDGFLSVLHTLNPHMATGFTTASNPHNFIKVNKLKKLQIRDELYGSDGSDHTDPTKHPSYLKMRADIIRSAWPEGKAEQVSELARRTRGMNLKDISESLLKYQQTGEFPAYPGHPTNTAHPLTGSWTERILSLEDYKEIYSRNNFTLKIFWGFYDDTDSGLKGWIRKIMNNIPGKLGKNFSPFIGLIGLGK